VGKVFERLVYNELYDYLIMHQLLTDKNSGFKRSDGTSYQLVKMLNYLYSEIDKRRDVAVVFWTSQRLLIESIMLAFYLN